MEHGTEISRARSGRHLKTAAEALTALRILGTRPTGLTSDALAAALGKSTATARYLLNTLCQEGYAERDGRAGTYRLTELPPWGDTWGGPDDPDDTGIAQVPGAVDVPQAVDVVEVAVAAPGPTPPAARATPGPVHRQGGDHPPHPRGRAGPPRPTTPSRRDPAPRRVRHPLGSIEEER